MQTIKNIIQSSCKHKKKHGPAQSQNLFISKNTNFARILILRKAIQQAIIESMVCKRNKNFDNINQNINQTLTKDVKNLLKTYEYPV